MEMEPTLELVEDALMAAAADPQRRDRTAAMLARVMRDFAWPPHYGRYFGLWQRHGFHLTPVHFYWPIPDTSSIPAAAWEAESELAGIDMNDNLHRELLTDVFPRFRAEYEAFPRQPQADQPGSFYLDNPLFSGTDALVLYCLVRHFRPRRVVEVGSGFSSLITAAAALRNGHTELMCIEPYPNDVLRAGFPGLTSLVQRKVQDVDMATFLDLGPGDILFIDSSHVVGVGGDVNFLFLEVLPRLQPGVVVHVHDIFLPLPGRRDWVEQEYRFWNEQEVLQAFLACNSAYQVVFGNTYAERRFPALMREAFPTSPWWGGGSFWMQRRPAASASA